MSLRIYRSANPMERNLGIRPMSREDELFWKLRRERAGTDQSQHSGWLKTLFERKWR